MRDRNSLIRDFVMVTVYTGVAYVVLWVATHPDDLKKFKMNYLKQMEVKSMGNAKFWADRADQYKSAYEILIY